MTIYARLTRAAERDLTAIWTDGAARWGTPQANLYIRQIEATMNVLAANPQAGPACDDVRKGYRKFQTGSHMLFYRLARSDLTIVRILHADSDDRGHQFQSDRGHPSDLMAAT